MKKTFSLLTIIPLFTLSGLASPLDFGKKWPVYWRQFKTQPEEEDKKYITVRFTTSMKEACEQYENALHNERVARVDFNLFQSNIDSKKFDYPSYEEYKKAEKEIMKPHLSTKVIARIRVSSTGVEVLRQAGYKDWKKYSRWDLFGVGDLYREIAQSEKTTGDFIKDHPYMNKTSINARKECKIYGYKVKIKDLDLDDYEYKFKR